MRALTLALLMFGLLAAGLRLQDQHQLSHHKYYLGKRNSLHGYAFVHFHHYDQHANRTAADHPHLHYPQQQQHQDRKRQLFSPCTGAISPGARWRSSEGYWVHTRNSLQLSESFIVTAVGRAMDRWNCALDQLGLTTIGPRLGVRRGVAARDFVLTRPTGENEIGFGPIEGRPGTVAVTVVWGVFGGPEQMREIREFKMRFDEQHYRFGNASLSSVFMDLEAIATHEVGHAHGLDDIYSDGCRDVTMFGTSRNGETKKRSLEEQDVDGLRALYS